MTNLTFNENVHLNSNAEFLNKITSYSNSNTFITRRCNGDISLHENALYISKRSEKIDPYRHRKFIYKRFEDINV